MSEQTDHLSPDTREKLEAELAEAGVQDGTSHEIPTTPATKEIGAFAERRGILAGLFVLALVVGGIASLAVGSWWVLIVALALLAVGLFVILRLVTGVLSETEHASPELAEDLRAEGVRSPDRLLSDLAQQRSDDQSTAPPAAHGESITRP